MSVSYQAKDVITLGRQLKVQQVVIPFQIVGNATPASKTQSSDEPSVLFIATEGIDGIAAELTALGDSVTFTTSPSDASGIANLLLVLGEQVSKIVSCTCQRLSTTAAEADDTIFVALGDADGKTTLNNVALTIDSNGAFTSGTHNLVIKVDYIVAD